MRVQDTARRYIQNITDLAQTELLNAQSCTKLAVTSSRPEYWLDMSKAFRESVNTKLLEAEEVARLTLISVAECVNAKEEQGICQDSQG